MTQYLTNNTYRTITMKKSIFYLCLLFIAQTAFAADSLYVREQQIPILIDRTDNVLLEMRIPAQKGDVLNNFTLQFGEETNLSDIKAVRLFYSGTEAPSREGIGMIKICSVFWE